MNITAIIPVFNIADYIGAALSSALAQNPAFSRIIVVDDGSTDETRKVVARYDDPRILYHYKPNCGLGPARNTGLDLADTEFIYFMDGDDILEPGLTTAFHAAIKKYPNLDLFAFSALDFEHGTGRILSTSDYMRRKHAGYFDKGLSALCASLLSRSFPVCAFMYIFRRSAIEGEMRHRFMNILHEDEPFTPQLFMNCGSTLLIGDIFYRRRVRPNSIMTSPASIRNVIGYLASSRWWLDAMQTIPRNNRWLFKREAKYFYALAVRYAGRAKLQAPQFMKLVNSYTPEFSGLSRVDLEISKISKRTAFELARLRPIL